MRFSKMIFLQCLSVMLLSACSMVGGKQEPGLPPETQVGANTFGCKVNGKLLLPKSIGFSPARIGLRTRLLSENHLNIIAGNAADDDSRMVVFDIRNLGTRVFDLKDTTKIGDFFVTTAAYIDNNIMYGGGNSLDRAKGWIKITKCDKEKGIFSGTFEFTLYTKDSLTERSVEITEGRFDVKI